MLLQAIALIMVAVPPGPGIQVNRALMQGYDDMYNLRFERAHAAFHQFEKDHPGDPMGTVSDAAAYLFKEFDRLHILRSEVFITNGNYLRRDALQPDPSLRSAFEADLRTAAQQCQETLKKNPSDQSALLADVLRVALGADYDALIAHQNMKALTEIKEAQKEADKLLSVCPNCYDANLAIGVENYLLSQKAAPVRWLLELSGAQTNKEVGLEKLQVVAQRGVYLRPYAKVLLAIAKLRDGKKQDAKQLLAELANEFPQNAVFQSELKKLS